VERKCDQLKEALQVCKHPLEKHDEYHGIGSVRPLFLDYLKANNLLHEIQIYEGYIQEMSKTLLPMLT